MFQLLINKRIYNALTSMLYVTLSFVNVQSNDNVLIICNLLNKMKSRIIIFFYYDMITIFILSFEYSSCAIKIDTDLYYYCVNILIISDSLNYNIFMSFILDFLSQCEDTRIINILEKDNCDICKPDPGLRGALFVIQSQWILVSNQRNYNNDFFYEKTNKIIIQILLVFNALNCVNKFFINVVRYLNFLIFFENLQRIENFNERRAVDLLRHCWSLLKVTKQFYFYKEILFDEMLRKNYSKRRFEQNSIKIFRPEAKRKSVVDSKNENIQK
ncbi:hypothetical protein RFI_31328 [Reticulomyxa filosa]|uniref:Uncharacterized protein n=1 Tax=Reticulomyxa filosa TaxID=46433 RepID=X6LVV4_RETFI|nr:hypothetical protein RFI_31328 [Reticulomyxa filosa]|eukprot:ETO06068.1 hypothetical protein RFI_31328 [Reticulomyxa filosa]